MSVIGQRVLRVEDPRFLTGDGTYVENLDLPGALHLTFVRSPVAHGRIVSVDGSEAASLPGIRVFTAADLALKPLKPLPVPGMEPLMPRPPLAEGVVRFAGEIVAAVAAPTRTESIDAAELVLVDYEPLDAVVDPKQALAGDVLLHPEAGTNVCLRLERGEPAAEDATTDGLFAECDVVVAGQLVSQRLAASPLEPRSAAARVDEHGRLHVWLATQTPHQDRDGLARALGLEKQDVHVIAPDVGGGFGAKMLSVEEIVLARIALETGVPVRWTETRVENMLSLRHGRGALLEFELGGRRDGEVLAYRLRALQDAGAYPELGAFLPTYTGLMATGVYRIPRARFESTSVVTNTAPVGAYRGAGRPEAAQAIERAIDLFAAEAGLDPVDVRRRNLVQRESFPYETPSGATYDCGDYEAALDLALERAGYASLREEQRRRREAGDPMLLGIGVAAYVEVTNAAPEGELGVVEITVEGGAVLRTGSFSHGQGHETTFAMIAAEQLGLPVTAIRVVKGDTDAVARGAGTYASKSTQIGGVAAGEAAAAVVERALDLAADVLEIGRDDVVLDRAAGRFHGIGAPAHGLTWAELAAALDGDGRLDGLRAEHMYKPESATYPFGVHVAVVEVDSETGMVSLRRLVAVDDAGTIVNPVIADGQVHGGLAAGAAQALHEELAFDEDGNPLSASFLAYCFPSAADLPSFERVPMVTPTPVNPLGVKGIGESGTIGSTPAVQSAVVDALAPYGVRHVDMPLSGERVWRALREARGER